MKDHEFRSLIGDAQQLEAERALAEIRAGRPVKLRRDGAAMIVWAYENLDGAMFETLRRLAAGARLVMSAARVRRLRDGASAPGAIPLDGLDFEALSDIVAGVEATYSNPIRVADDFEDCALELVRVSLLLPAAVVVEAERLPAAATAALAEVDAEAVRNFQSQSINAMRIVSRAPVPLEGVENCEFVVFRGGEGLRDQVAIVISKPDPAKPVLARIHSACLTGDLFGSLKCDCGDQLRGAVKRMADEGGGVLLYLDQEGRGNGIANKIRAYCLQHQGHDTYDADEILGFENDHRRFDVAAVMLRLLGYRSVRLMTNNPQKIESLEKAGLDVVATHRVIARANGHNARYLEAKRDKAGHLFEKDIPGLSFGGAEPSKTAA